MKRLHDKTANELINEVDEELMELDEEQKLAIRLLVDVYGDD